MSTMWERLSKMRPSKEDEQDDKHGAANKKSFFGKYKPGCVINDEQEIGSLLTLAAGQRCPCQLDLHHNGKKYIFACDYMCRSKHSVALIYGNDSKRIPLVPEMAVTVYFYVKNMNKYQFYSFSAPIHSTHKENQNNWVLEFKTPVIIECRQRRTALRVSPDPSHIKRIMAWPMPAMRGGLKSNPVKDWGKPFVLFIANKTEHNFLKDISATGIRLTLPYEQYAEQMQSLASGTSYALLLSLEPIGDAEPEIFLLAMIIKNQRASDDMKFLEIGAQFVAISAAPKNIEEDIVWKYIRNKGGMVEQLDKWITAWSLDELRKVNKFDL